MLNRVLRFGCLAVFVLGCAPSGEPAELLTHEDRCYDEAVEGLLLSGRHGTDFESGTSIVSVRWPSGFSGVRVGGEIAVLDLTGNVVATTGRHYWLRGGWLKGVDGFGRGERAVAFMACGYPGSVIQR
jgi:hypothetical protein